VIENWYSKLCVAVGWIDAISGIFNVKSGVKQGSILSPVVMVDIRLRPQCAILTRCRGYIQGLCMVIDFAIFLTVVE